MGTTESELLKKRLFNLSITSIYSQISGYRLSSIFLHIIIFYGIWKPMEKGTKKDQL